MIGSYFRLLHDFASDKNFCLAELHWGNVGVTSNYALRILDLESLRPEQENHGYIGHLWSTGVRRFLDDLQSYASSIIPSHPHEEAWKDSLLGIDVVMRNFLQGACPGQAVTDAHFESPGPASRASSTLLSLRREGRPRVMSNAPRATGASSSGAPSTIQEITSRDADEASLRGSDASKFTTSTEEEDLVDVSSEAAEVQPAMNRGEETASFHRETA